MPSQYLTSKWLGRPFYSSRTGNNLESEGAVKVELLPRDYRRPLPLNFGLAQFWQPKMHCGTQCFR